MTTIAYPGESSESYPEVFTKPPPMPAVLKPGQLSEQQFKQFFEEVRLFACIFAAHWDLYMSIVHVFILFAVWTKSKLCTSFSLIRAMSLWRTCLRGTSYSRLAMTSTYLWKNWRKNSTKRAKSKVNASTDRGEFVSLFCFGSTRLRHCDDAVATLTYTY